MFQLAWQMGRLDVDAMLAEMSSPLISEWVAFLHLHVSEAERLNAALQATLCNIHGDGKRVWQPSDFIRQRMPLEDQDAGEMFAALGAVTPGDED